MGIAKKGLASVDVAFEAAEDKIFFFGGKKSECSISLLEEFLHRKRNCALPRGLHLKDAKIFRTAPIN